MDKDTYKDNRRLRAFVKRFVNPILRYAARAGLGPFALLRHEGRRSGKQYENPIWVWRMKDGFMIVLTYGRGTDWLRNLQAADQGSLRWHRREYVFKRPQFIDAKTASQALPPFVKFVLRLRGAHEYVKLADAR
jgi:deazaflavin-dependent oxidoreductase (nitroreductase family)